MKRVCFVAVVLAVALCSQARCAEEDEASLTSGQMVVLNVVMHGVVNLYSTSCLIGDSYNSHGLTRDEAARAVERNRDFLKVLNEYAMAIKRQGTKGDEQMASFVGSVVDVCTNLDLFLNATESFVEKNDRASVEMMEKYREKVEMLIETMVRKGKGEL